MSEPTTKAGRQLLYIHGEAMREPVLAIEAEARDDSLDAAWAEAGAALPEGWALNGLLRTRIDEVDEWWWAAMAGDPAEGVTGRGRTPAAALRALAAKLRERAG